MTDMLIRGGTIIAMDSARRIIPDGAVAVSGDRITYVGPAALGPPDAAQILDAHGGIILPGLIDAHGHGGHGLLKTIASDTPSLWGKVVTPTYYHFTDTDYWSAEGQLSALERLMFGVTTGLCVIASEPRSDDPDLAGAHAAAYAEAGIREVVAVGPCNPPFPRPASRWRDGRRHPAPFTFEDAMAGAEEVIRVWHGSANGRISVMLTPFLIVPSCDSSGPTPADVARLTAHDLMQSRRIRESARAHGVRIHSDAFGGMVRLAADDPNGLLGPDVLLQHCTGLGLDEIRILADTGTAVGHAPLSGTLNRARCPVVELLEAGAIVAITTDGTSPRTTFDLLPGLRVAARLQQAHFHDNSVMPAGKLLEMVTIDAARALGMDSQIGSLEVGKKADVVTLGGGLSPHLVPLQMHVHRVVYQAAGQDVNHVVVDGRVLLRDRIPQVMDPVAIQALAEAETVKVIERARLHPFLKPPAGFWGTAVSRLSADDDRAERLPE
jgi:cytosine/adenosine deaminase-related metal-dependent hydrolase